MITWGVHFQSANTLFICCIMVYVEINNNKVDLWNRNSSYSDPHRQYQHACCSLYIHHVTLTYRQNTNTLFSMWIKLAGTLGEEWASRYFTCKQRLNSAYGGPERQWLHLYSSLCKLQTKQSTNAHPSLSFPNQQTEG